MPLTSSPIETTHLTFSTGNHTFPHQSQFHMEQLTQKQTELLIQPHIQELVSRLDLIPIKQKSVEQSLVIRNRVEQWVNDLKLPPATDRTETQAHRPGRV